MQTNQNENLRKFITIIEAVDQTKNDNSLIEVPGPIINAPSYKIAIEELKQKGINYLKIVGEIKEEIIEVQPDPLIPTSVSGFPQYKPIKLPTINKSTENGKVI